MNTVAAQVLLALGCVSAVLPASQASAAAERCAGQAPTIVSDAKRVTGTSGRDVIVVLAKRVKVDAGAGADLICVRGSGGVSFVDPGEGDDRVLVQARTITLASLQGGRDSFVGGRGADLVSSGTDGERNRDRIVLRGGADSVTLSHSMDHRRAELVGGTGRDTLRVMVRRGRLVVEAAAERATREGHRLAQWDSFEEYDLSSDGPQEFIGSDYGDVVRFGGFGAVSALLGSGDDSVSVHLNPFDHLPALDGGDGTDVLTLDAGLVSSVMASLVTDRVDLVSSFGDETSSFRIPGFEGFVASAPYGGPDVPDTHVELIGDEGDNVLQAGACDVVLLGGGGNDDLRVGFDSPRDASLYQPDTPRCAHTSQVFGEAGDDVLTSSDHYYVSRRSPLDPGPATPLRVIETRINDVLDGGEGIDSADAGLGTDTCLAETRADCEA